jgi:hypothetical protein
VFKQSRDLEIVVAKKFSTELSDKYFATQFLPFRVAKRQHLN